MGRIFRIHIFPQEFQNPIVLSSLTREGEVIRCTGAQTVYGCICFCICQKDLGTVGCNNCQVFQEYIATVGYISAATSC